MLKDVYISGSVRTPIGRFGGGFADVSASDLGAAVIRESLLRVGARAR